MSHFDLSRRSSRRISRLASGVLAGACALSLLAGCAVTVPPMNPTPNIALLSQSKSLEIAFGSDVADGFDLDTGSASILIQSWHASLENGFRNGFRAAFPSKRGASADLTLRIDEARAEFTTGRNGHVRIQYAATLVGRDGTVLRRASGIASRRGAVPQVAAAPEEIGALTGDMPGPPELPARNGRIDADVAAAIDAMYEQLATELFACAAGQAPCPAATAT